MAAPLVASNIGDYSYFSQTIDRSPLQDEDDRVDLDACTVSDEGEKKPAPIMRHQWMRGSIDDSQVRVECLACLRTATD